MTSLRDHQSNDFVKLLLIGDPKSGKTGSLVSLVEAGYHLRVLDMDNLLDFLKGQILKRCPDKIDNVESFSIRDKYKATAAGMLLDGKADAWVTTLKLLNNWKYTDAHGTEIDFGNPANWGPNVVLVIDSLSRWCDACFNFHESMVKPGMDRRAIYGDSQKDMEKQLASLTSPTFATNVIVICHTVYQERDDGKTKIFPKGIGQAMSPNIPSYFPNYIRYTNENDKRTIQLQSDRMIDLATTRPDLLGKSLDVETGLAELFKVLRQKPKEETTPTKHYTDPQGIIDRERRPTKDVEPLMKPTLINRR